MATKPMDSEEKLRERFSRFMGQPSQSLPKMPAPPRRSRLVKDGVPTWVIGLRDSGVIKAVPKDNSRGGALRLLLQMGMRATCTVACI